MAAIGAAAGAGVLASAVAVKLARVVLLAPIVGLTSVSLRRAATAEAGRAVRRPPVVPLFVAGFVAAVAARSLGMVPHEITRAVPGLTTVLLAAALFALGTGVDLRRLARGGRSLLLGGIATAIIGGISLLGVVVIG